jgi:hypothetical protein
MTDKSDIFFDCPYVRVVETKKTLFGYWYKVFARCGEYSMEIECENSDCHEALKRIKKCFREKALDELTKQAQELNMGY